MSTTTDGVTRFEYSALKVPLEEIATALVNRIDRGDRERVAALHPGLPAVLRLLVRTSEAAWASIRHLAGPGEHGHPARADLIVCMSPLARTVLDALFTVILLFDQPKENVRWYYASGWREAKDYHQRLSQKHGADPRWTAWLQGYQTDYVDGWESDAEITEEEKVSPKKSLKWWPNPGGMVTKATFSDSKRKEFLAFLNDWFYKNLSGDSHLSLLGLARRAGHLFDYGGSADEPPDVLFKYRGQVTLDALSLYIAFLSEIAGQLEFSLECKRLHECWAYLHAWDEARELYEIRYRSWLSA